MSETLKDLLEYLQNKIDSGEHKIFFNDLGWDIKTIDCINAINEQQEEIERLNKELELEKQIKKEAIGYIEENKDKYYQDYSGDDSYTDTFLNEGEIIKLLQILDKENK